MKKLFKIINVILIANSVSVLISCSPQNGSTIVESKIQLGLCWGVQDKKNGEWTWNEDDQNTKSVWMFTRDQIKSIEREDKLVPKDNIDKFYLKVNFISDEKNFDIKNQLRLNTFTFTLNKNILDTNNNMLINRWKRSFITLSDEYYKFFKFNISTNMMMDFNQGWSSINYQDIEVDTTPIK